MLLEVIILYNLESFKKSNRKYELNNLDNNNNINPLKEYLQQNKILDRFCRQK